MPWETLHTLSHTLAWTLLHFLWQGALIGVVYLLALRQTGSTRQRHALALSGLLLVLVMPLLTFQYLHQGSAPAAADAALASAASETAAIGAGENVLLAESADAGYWTSLLAFAWLAGALLVALRLLRDWHLLRQAIRTGREPPAELLAMLDQQARRVGVGQRVRLRLTARITSAGVYGWLRPVILLPTALALCMPRDQLETLLAHELAHIRRADFLANSLALLARTLLYFHPVVHRLCRDLERSREQLCDDLVVSLDIDRIKYARALSSAESFRQQVKVPVPLLTATGGELSERVHRILDIRPVAHSGKERAPLLLAFAAVLAAIATLAGTDSTRLLGVARPEFQAAYLALTAARAPDIVAADLVLGDRRPQLPALTFTAAAAGDAAVDTASTSTAPTPDVATPASTMGGAMAAMDAPARPAPQTLPAAPLDIGVATPAIAIPPLPTAAADGSDSAGIATADTSAAQPLPPRILRQVQPHYPRSARLDGIEGSVTLGYRIGANGAPDAIRVISATPAGLFEQATIRALQRWRFAADTDSEYQQTFDFLIGTQADSGDRCEPRIGTRICRQPGRD